MPYITSGQLKSLAVSTAQRSSALPNAPTVAETGIGDFDLALWIGVFVPRATPRAVWEQAVSSNAHDNAGAALIGVARKLLHHPGLLHLLSTGHTGRVWVKRCGAYSKWGWTETGLQGCNPLLRDNFGVDHFVWGRDCRTHSSKAWPSIPLCVRAWMPGFPIREKGGPCWFSHRPVFSSFEIFERPQTQLPCSDACNYLTHVTNALPLVGTDRNVRF